MAAAGAAIVSAVLIILLAAIIFAIVEVEKDTKYRKGSMAVYGKSFMNLPHGSLKPTLLERTDIGSPSFKFHPQQVAGVSFARLS